MICSVLPDLTITKDRWLSHFQYKDEYPYNLVNADEFIKKYLNMKDDVSIGYIIHLLTDRFYNDWYYKSYKLKRINTTKEFKHNLFDSYDKYILKHFKLDKFRDFNIIEKIPEYKDLKFDSNYLKEYINRFNYEIDINYIDDNYSIDKIDILQKLYDDCLEYIFNWLKSNDNL